MPDPYKICLDPSVPPVQYSHHKVPLHYKEQIEKAPKEMEDLHVIAPVTHQQNGSPL